MVELEYERLYYMALVLPHCCCKGVAFQGHSFRMNCVDDLSYFPNFMPIWNMSGPLSKFKRKF